MGNGPRVSNEPTQGGEDRNPMESRVDAQQAVLDSDGEMTGLGDNEDEAQIVTNPDRDAAMNMEVRQSMDAGMAAQETRSENRREMEQKVQNAVKDMDADFVEHTTENSTLKVRNDLKDEYNNNVVVHKSGSEDDPQANIYVDSDASEREVRNGMARAGLYTHGVDIEEDRNALMDDFDANNNGFQDADGDLRDKMMDRTLELDEDACPDGKEEQMQQMVDAANEDYEQDVRMNMFGPNGNIEGVEPENQLEESGGNPPNERYENSMQSRASAEDALVDTMTELSEGDREGTGWADTYEDTSTATINSGAVEPSNLRKRQIGALQGEKNRMSDADVDSGYTPADESFVDAWSRKR